jgi:hypothetical protein
MGQLDKHGSNHRKATLVRGSPEFSTGNKGVGRSVLFLFVKMEKIALKFGKTCRISKIL